MFDKNILLVSIILFMSFVSVSAQYEDFSIIGGEIIMRDVPSQVQPGQEFEIKYIAKDVSGKWGASIVDNVAGGCIFPDGSTTLRTVMLSSEGSEKVIKITAPDSGQCTFSGNYQFGTDSTKMFNDATIIIDNSDSGNGVDEDKEESFFEKEVFKIGDFSVTGLILTISLIIVLTILAIGGRKK